VVREDEQRDVRGERPDLAVLTLVFAQPMLVLDHVTMPTLPDPSTGQRYLHGHHEAVLRSHRQRTAANSAAYLLPRLRPDASVLDVGCGPGTITADLAAHVPAGTVVGIDAEPAIVAEAQAGAEASLGARGQANVTFEVGDVYHLAFDDGRFDVVHAHQVLQHLAEPTAALREMRRVCRPGGLVACRDADYGAMFWYPSFHAMTEWQGLYREVARSAGGEPDAGRHLIGWARAAGFSHVEASASMWCFATPEERAWWGGLWAERLTLSRFAEQATVQHLAGVADLARLADGWLAWVAEEDGCFFVPHTEVLCTP
jgi:2-polyprenyl-3-methyl-5-hydroxy-6-metoxy-1,4-benzoquinol methylase